MPAVKIEKGSAGGRTEGSDNVRDQNDQRQDAATARYVLALFSHGPCLDPATNVSQDYHSLLIMVK